MNEDLLIGGHISQQFDNELDEVRSRVLKMGGLVEAQLEKTIVALRDGDPSGLKDVSATDVRVNTMEMQIDEECTQILAKRSPAAGDLRLIVATSKSVRDLERIGDEAERVAKMVAHALELEFQKVYFRDLLSLSEHVRDLLNATLDTYARMETRSAVRNMRLDAAIDDEYARVVMKLVDRMKSNPENISGALDVMWAARSLERIGDHCINICENVIYLVEGQDIRHASIEDVAMQLDAE